jgi:hypothetical protein
MWLNSVMLRFGPLLFLWRGFWFMVFLIIFAYYFNKNLFIMSSIQSEIDVRFREYVRKNLRRGDKQKLAGLLECSYPTLMNYLGGLVSDPIRQGIIMDYFEQRKKSESKMRDYVREKIDNIYKENEAAILST